MAALSACHMLWFLDLLAPRAPAGDDATRTAPRARWTAPASPRSRSARRWSSSRRSMETKLRALHDAAHERCFIANTVSCPVEVERLSALDGVKVLDLSRLLPGGFCSLLMADFGADVLKVEDTGMGDYVRWAPPQYEGAEPSAASALFLSLNRGKRSIRLNLKEEAGREVLLKLVKEYDVLLESFRPGVLDRLGVGYERLQAGEPRPRVLRDHRLRPGRPLPRPLRPRHELPRPRRPARPDRRRRRPADPGRRPDRRPRRRRADGGVRHPRRAAGARPLRRGAVRRHLDGRRLAVLDGDGGGTPPGRGQRAASAATSSWPARYVCYRPYAVQGRLGHAAARSSRSSGRPGAAAWAART